MKEPKHRNEVHLAGELMRDPELKCSKNGKAFCNFSVRTRFGDRVEYHNCTAWEANAERLAKDFRAGFFIRLCGRLQTRNYEREGQKHYATSIVVWNLGNDDPEAAEKKAPLISEKSVEAAQAERKPEPPFVNMHGVTVTDDDIPF